jgi:hypothetical protein
MYGIQPKQNKRRGLQEKIYIYISKSKRRKQSKRRVKKLGTTSQQDIYNSRSEKQGRKEKEKEKRVSQR